MKTDAWFEALTAFIEANRDRPLAWGEWDCCQFAAAAVAVMTGIDYRSAFPAYENEVEARALLANQGGIEALISSVLGPPKPIAWAKRGDVLAIETGAGMAAGICLGLYCVVVGVERLQFLRSSAATAAWGID